MAECYDCGFDYEDPGWIEAVIPDDIWSDISPTGGDGGILCILCISKRLVKKGYKTASVPVILCGIEPLRNITENEHYNRLLNKYGDLIKKYENLRDREPNKRE